MTDTRKRDELNRLDDAMLEDILSLSDEDVKNELIEVGLEPGAGHKAFETALERAKMDAGLDELHAARKALIEDKRQRDANVRSYSGDDARALLARVEREIPELTKAARNADGSELSDKDALAQLRDVMELLEELGIDLEDKPPT